MDFMVKRHQLYADDVLKRDFTWTRWNRRSQNLCMMSSNGGGVGRRRRGAAKEELQVAGDKDKRGTLMGKDVCFLCN